MGGSSAPATTEKKKPGMGDVFSALNSGSSVTSGLTKVDRSQMTHKNPALREQPGLAPKEKAGGGAKPAEKKAAAKKPPSLELTKGTWFCENYDGESALNIPDVEIKQGVYIANCRNTNIIISDKVKSIAIDGCHRVHVTFKSVVSSVELVNCQRVSVEVTEFCPSIAIDKSDGSSVILSKAAFANPPQLVTSKISESNLVVPGATDEADPIEIPIPEQYVTLISKDKKLHTNPMGHGE